MDPPTVAVQLAIAGAFAVGWRLFNVRAARAARHWITGRPWRHCVARNHKKMMLHIGYPLKPAPPHFPAGTTDDMSLHMYAFLAIIGVIHATCALLMAPAAFGGWEAAGAMGQWAFLLGTLADVGFDLQDMVTITLSTFLPDAVGIPRTPRLVFFFMLLHHPLAVALIIPMNCRYAHVPGYHHIAFWLPATAAVGCALNAYKMALDIKAPFQFRQFQAIAVAQLCMLIWARLVVWFPAAYELTMQIREDGPPAFFYAAAGLGGLMSAFHCVLVAIAARTAMEWLPRPCPDPAALAD